MSGSASARPLALLLALLAQPAVAGEGTHACVAIESDRDRLACYDAAFGAPAAAAASAASKSDHRDAAAPTPAAEPRTATRAREEFGLSEGDRRARRPPQDVEPDRIEAVVARVDRRPTGGKVVTLADGQVWAQIDSDDRSRVKQGDTVTIRKGSLGSFLLLGPDRIAVRVRRLR